MRYIRIIVLAATAAGSPAAAFADGNIEAGKARYFEQGCYSCHGYNGTGRTPLVGGTSGIMTSEDLFVRFLRLRGDQNPVPPSYAMPSYSADVLADEEARDIYAYINALSDEPPAVEDIDVFVELLESAGKDSSERE